MLLKGRVVQSGRPSDAVADGRNRGVSDSWLLRLARAGWNAAGAQRVSVGSAAVVCGSSAAARSEREPRLSFWKTWVRWASTVRRVM
jgi:hypothetical protein